MFRVLLCISCCSAPPTGDRPARRKSSSQPPNGALKKIPGEEGTKKHTEDATSNEKDQLLSNQIQANNENYGTKTGATQGKLTLSLGDSNTSFSASNHDEQLILRGADSTSVATGMQQETKIIQQNSLSVDQTEVRKSGEPDSSLLSSVEIGPFGESVSTTTANYRESIQARQISVSHSQEHHEQVFRASSSNAYERENLARLSEKPYEPLLSPGVVAKNVPSTTKIGDYARIEYSPVEDLDSITTASQSRFGSEKGGSQSRTGSAKANTLEGTSSRRSSQGGIESTSISIASQLSNEQFQQNLTNMLESVNSNYQTIGAIGLPLGPPIDGTFTSETTKTSPETPGAALTSASQDSLSDTAFEDVSPLSSRPGTLQSNVSSGAALVGDSLEKSNLVEELAEFSQPAPLATCEDDEQTQISEPYGRVVSSAYDSKSTNRVGSPQSMTTTTSGGLTNPTPTPSELSGVSGKKKKLRAKSLFKKLRPGSKKKNKEDA